MNESEWYPLLGLANRARKVVSGEDLVIKEIRHARAKLVLLAADASPNTEKRYLTNANFIMFRLEKLKTVPFSDVLLGKKLA